MRQYQPFYRPRIAPKIRKGWEAAMKAWFGPLPGTNVGYHGVWVGYAVMPVSWEGWLVTLAYISLQVAAGFAMTRVLDALGWAGAWLFVQVTILHLVYLWVASRRYVAVAEMDPSVLPADLRNRKPRA
jgi:hypothetical protein